MCILSAGLLPRLYTTASLRPSARRKQDITSSLKKRGSGPKQFSNALTRLRKAKSWFERGYEDSVGADKILAVGPTGSSPVQNLCWRRRLAECTNFYKYMANIINENFIDTLLNGYV